MLHALKKRPNITKISSTQNTPNKVPSWKSTTLRKYQTRKLPTQESTGP